MSDLLERIRLILLVSIAFSSLLYLSGTPSTAKSAPTGLTTPTSSTPKIDTIQVTSIGDTAQTYEQVIDTSPFHDGTMIVSGLYNSGYQMAWATSDYWSTSNGLNGPYCTNGLPPGAVDNAGSYSGNGSYYAGFWLCPYNHFQDGFQLMKSTGDRNDFVLTNGLLWENSDVFTDFQGGATVYPCSAFEDAPVLTGDKGPGSTWVYAVVVIYFASTANSMNCDKGQGLAFEASSDGANTWPIRIAFRGSLGDNSLFSMSHHPLAVTTNSTIYFTGFDNGLACVTSGVGVYKSTDHGSSWSHSCVTNGKTPSGDSTVAVYGTTVVYSVFSYVFTNVSITDNHYFVSRSNDAGRTWSVPLRIDDGPDTPGILPTSHVLHAVARVSTQGRLDVAWQDFRNTLDNHTRTDLYYTYTQDGSTIATPLRLTPNGPFNWCLFFNPGNLSCQSGNDFFGLTETNNATYISFFRSSTLNGGLFSYGLYITSISFPPQPSADFTITLTPAELDTSQNSSPTTTLKVSSLNGFSGNALISTTAPTGLTVTPSTASLAVAPGTAANLDFQISTGSTPAGVYSVNFTGQAGTITQLASLTVKIALLVSLGDFSIAADPMSMTLLQGTSGSARVTVSGAYGFAGTVLLSTSSPSDITASLSTSTTQLSTNTPTETLTLSVSAPAATPPYTYQVRINGTTGAKTRTASVSVLVSSQKQPPPQQPGQAILGLPVDEFYLLAGVLLVSAGLSSVLVFRRKIKGRRSASPT